MKKLFLVLGIAVLLLATTVIAKEKPNGQPFKAIWEAIDDLQDQIDDIQLTQGPPGPPGPEGECTCDITKEDFDALEAKVTALEQAQECISGETRDCYTGSPETEGVGECHGGTEDCVDYHWTGVCVGEVTPSEEVCDGKDNDCDGETDEGNPGGGESCDTGEQGICAEGTIQCINGELTCIRNNDPTEEICFDGSDNDCDGETDEEDCLKEAGSSCSENSDCLSGYCECADSTCFGPKICTYVDCFCEYGLNCNLYIADGIDDADDSCGTEVCDGSGGCGPP